jgi:hypothetical protein
MSTRKQEAPLVAPQSSQPSGRAAKSEHQERARLNSGHVRRIESSTDLNFLRSELLQTHQTILDFKSRDKQLERLVKKHEKAEKKLEDIHEEAIEKLEKRQESEFEKLEFRQEQEFEELDDKHEKEMDQFDSRWEFLFEHDVSSDEDN